jgi:hypothetical protein
MLSAHRLLLAALAAELENHACTFDMPRPWPEPVWIRLLASADWHRVTPVLRVLPADPDVVPAWVANHVRDAQLQGVARRLMVERAQTAVQRVLRAAGVSAMLLKGAALVECVYPAALWRDMSDVDVLVPPEQMAAARAALVNHGYQHLGAAADTTSAALLKHDGKFLDADGVVPVELHRHVVDGDDAQHWPVGDLWLRSRPSPVGDHMLPSLDDLLMHVCLHFMAGRRMRSEGALGQLRDITWIARRDDLNWATVAREAARYGVLERVQAALAVARHLGVLDACPLLAFGAPSESEIERFVVRRVLIDEARAPVGSFSGGLDGLRHALWWARVHLGDVTAGELTDDPALRGDAAAGRWLAVVRMVRQIVADPRWLAGDIRAGRWLSSLRRRAEDP